MKRKEPCTACGKTVAVRYRVQERGVGPGKARVRHKCPHGQWCIAGRLNQGFNYGHCPDCRHEKVLRERAQAT